MSSPEMIDSHIHLYPAQELESSAWSKKGHPLYGQHSIEEYLQATESLSKVSDQKLRGFIFIETDRKSSLEYEAGWIGPLHELDWIMRIANGTPRAGEGHESRHASMCLGIVLWAPLPSGADSMRTYVEKAKSRAVGMWHLVKGFRYLVQDKPKGTMLGNGFIDALRWMGRHRFTFDLGVDARSGGLWQLTEAVEMISRAHDGVPEHEKVVVVINHMCKPDMLSRDPDGEPTPGIFDHWKAEMARLASFSNTYMKVSGGFSEIKPLHSEEEQGPLGSAARTELLESTQIWVERWLQETLSLFGPTRIMFGSDWPVCNVGGGGNQTSWMNWWSLAYSFAEQRISLKDQAGFWGSNARRAYGVQD